jgi:hypothetical protein
VLYPLILCILLIGVLSLIGMICYHCLVFYWIAGIVVYLLVGWYLGRILSLRSIVVPILG